MTRKNREIRGYRSWRNAKERCLNPNHPNYHNYGGRGITICDRWLEWENFLQDMGERPLGPYSLERIDVNGNYEPNNCKWGTLEEQNSNRRSTPYFTYNGVTKTLLRWAKDLNINRNTLHSRIYKHGWSIERAFQETPDLRESLTYKGIAISWKGLAEMHNLTESTLYARVKTYGWTLEDALSRPVIKRRTKALGDEI